jgi:acyl carrier protein
MDEDVLRVVRSNLPGVRNVEHIEVDTDLWNSGMDSLANMAVMIAVEDAFGIEFTDELLTREVFATVATIADAVRSLQPVP